MIVKSCKFVEASSIFKNYGLAWDVFINSDPKCTWGDNNRSMVTPDVIIDALENSDLNVGNEESQVRFVVERLKNIEPNTYVDLEN